MQQFINVEQALERLRGNKKLYHMLLKSFMNDTHWDELQQQISASDYENAAKTAHTIKGVAANLSLDALYASVVALESELKGDACTPKSVEAVKEDLDRTVECIEVLLGQDG